MQLWWPINVQMKNDDIYTIKHWDLQLIIMLVSTGIFQDLFHYTRPLHWYCPEHIESWQSGGDHHARDLRVPVDLLHLCLTLVQEQELRRQVLHSFNPGPHVARLYWQIPLADHVVRCGGGEHTRVCGAPLHRGDGRAVLLEVCYRTPALQVKSEVSGVRTQYPYLFNEMFLCYRLGQCCWDYFYFPVCILFYF